MPNVPNVRILKSVMCEIKSKGGDYFQKSKRFSLKNRWTKLVSHVTLILQRNGTVTTSKKSETSDNLIFH